VKVLLVGGGTAGHTSPLLATAAALQQIDGAVEILCVGTSRGLENSVVPAAGFSLEQIPPVPLPRKFNLDLVRVPDRLTGAVRAASKVIKNFDPDVVVGFGGYVSTPVYLAAKRRGTPLLVHEQNALPGIANKLGARLAQRVAVSFPDTPLPKAEYVGLPLRQMIATLDREALCHEARATFQLSPDLPTLLVTGGSQGAARLNAAVVQAAPALAHSGVQVLHVVGPRGSASPPRSGVPYEVVNFVERMDLAYAAADLVLCRAGASSVCEAAAVGLPAVYVPLPIGNGEQDLNAQPVVNAGGGLLVKDSALTGDWIANHIPALITDSARLRAMGEAAAELIPKDADVRLARIVMDMSGDR
jgi:UDP-N-acetylglucosamine--N-acetylmuramyl-(pentapeptide) pyrophosphoryl-undecaprenol N-acetylglucosamine transferase